ncbi:MAG: hypothetical protein ACJ74P_13800 [Gaiellaceae bacterium]|jgi:hypothetical protein
MWLAFFIIVGVFVAILCVIAGIRLFREQDHPVNVMSAEEMDREESKL